MTSKPQMDWPKFQSHKIVTALKIARIKSTAKAPGYTIEDDAARQAFITVEFMEKHEPKVGGYLVSYSDGFCSYSPPEPFEEGYTPHIAAPGLDYGFDFSSALRCLKNSRCVRRMGWPAGQFIFLVSGSHFKVNRAPLLSILGEGTPVDYNGHIDIKNADGSISVWSQPMDDTLASDWEFAHA